MSDITLKDIKSGFNLSKINDNFQEIEDVINDEIVHSTGGNNIMSQDFDMNSKRVLNLIDAVSDKEPVTLGQARSLLTVAVDADAKHVAELSVAIADTKVAVGDVYIVKERTIGSGGSATWDAVLKGTTPEVDLPNTFDIVASTGDLTLALVIRPQDSMSLTALGNDLKAAAEWAQTNGALLYMTQDFTLTAPDKTGTYITFTDIDGFRFDTRGFTITDGNTYVDTEHGEVFSFTNSTNIEINAHTISQKAITPPTTAQLAWDFVVIKTGCSDVEVNLNFDGGRTGLLVINGSADFNNSKNINFDIVANNCWYPYNAVFSGDNVTGKIDAFECGRSYFIYGSNNVDLQVKSRDNQATAKVQALLGRGCSNVSVTTTDKDSVIGLNNPHTELIFADETPATHSNIDFTLNILNSATNWGNSFSLAKTLTNGTPDTTGRGHVLDGLSLRGTINEAASGNNPITTIGTFAGTDRLRDIELDGLSMPVGNASLRLDTLDGGALCKNVTCGGSLWVSGNNSPDLSPSGHTTFISCNAASFTDSPTATYRHTYINCSINNKALQSFDRYKEFVHTAVEGITINGNGTAVNTVTARFSGDMTATTNIFKVDTVGNDAMYRIEYGLTSPGAVQAMGIKTFSAFMNTSGVFSATIAIADEVTERTNGTPPVLTLSLVNGDSTGAFIAASATNHSSGASRATFKLTLLGQFERSFAMPIVD